MVLDVCHVIFDWFGDYDTPTQALPYVLIGEPRVVNVKRWNGVLHVLMLAQQHGAGAIP